ncbi:MAG: hypothetical protein GXC94_08405 [Comamonadaceae bacterium]|jgi:hypothetical protein|nr:hypothetical protein [Comamonadaceae bacterium]
MAFSYHPEAQAEFTAIRPLCDWDLACCFGLAIMRNNRIDAGTEPLQWQGEFIGPGRVHSALFEVEFRSALLTALVYVYQQFGQDVKVLAIDAVRNGLPVGPRLGGGAVQRARRRSD